MSAFVSLIKQFFCRLQIFRRKSAPLILYGNFQLFISLRYTDSYHSSLWRIFDCVIYQIFPGPYQQFLIDTDPLWKIFTFKLNRLLLPGSCRFDPLSELSCQFSYVHLLFFVHLITSCGDHLLQNLQIFFDSLNFMFQCKAVLLCFFQTLCLSHQLYVPPDHSQRRLQIMCQRSHLLFSG